MARRALGRSLVVATVLSALAGLSTGPAAAQDVCPPYPNGTTVTVAGQTRNVPGHGIYWCLGPDDVPVPEVYVDGGTVVVSINREGERTCMLGVGSRCHLALEM